MITGTILSVTCEKTETEHQLQPHVRTTHNLYYYAETSSDPPGCYGSGSGLESKEELRKGHLNICFLSYLSFV